MQKHLLLALMGIVIVLAAGCAQQRTAPAAQEASQGDYRLTATIKDIMDSVVDPNADYIWESVETIVSAKGVEEKKPRTDEDWKEVRRHAIALMEATNLLKMPGRRVAQAGEKADDANVELRPEQIEALINKDRAAWSKFASGLHDATMDVLKTIEAKDADALLNTSDRIDTACENCHLEYWYPSEKKPAQAPSQKGAN
jgi:DNA transposition AAA+ family ATPase